MITIRFFKKKDDENHADCMLVDLRFVNRLTMMIRWWMKLHPNGRICYSNPDEMRVCLQKLKDRRAVALMESFL